MSVAEEMWRMVLLPAVALVCIAVLYELSTSLAELGIEAGFGLSAVDAILVGLASMFGLAFIAMFRRNA
ncbi:hypothetical protein [Haladaptatus sp. YSMS36]|uniref:hypothetical protein n=1 Tax=Haladaptatus sp. YSMS36 TaxID=3033384 RepID=UPI0023E7EB55|nr:hypothetical protein [Haladaptatus sp. YSMS36]